MRITYVRYNIIIIIIIKYSYKESCNVLFLLPLSLPSYFWSRRVIFTHRAIHSRLTTGGVTIPPHLPLSLPVFFCSFFFFTVLFHGMQIFSLAAYRRERWSFLSSAGAARQSRSTDRLGRAASRSITLGFPNLAWRATSYRRPRLSPELLCERKEYREKVGEQCRCNFDGQKYSHNYSTLHCRYRMWDTCKDFAVINISLY